MDQFLRQYDPGAVAASHGPVSLFGPSFGSDKARTPQLIVDDARARGLEGELTLRFVGGPAAPAVLVRTSPGPVSQARYALYPRSGGDPVTADWRDFPVLARAVTTGVSVHEGIFFGSAGLWLNTATAAVLVWVCAGGTAAWWARTPA